MSAAILLSFGFGQLFKWSQRRSYNAPVVVTANYIVLATLLGGYYLSRGELDITAPILRVGVITGCAYVASMLVMTRALERGHVAPVLTAFRLSVLLPVLMGILVWGESVALWQTLGIGAALVSMVLMTWCNNNGKKHGLSAIGLVLLVFVLQGLVNCGNRWLHYAGLSAERLQVLFVIAATAALIGSAVVVASRHRPQTIELRAGAGIGAYNLVVLGVLLTALSKFPGTVLFPIHGCTILILDNLCAHFLWKELLSPVAIVGVVLGVVSIPLVAYGGASFSP